jgi:hypothetical protein
MPSDSHAPPRNAENLERPSYTMYENDNLLEEYQVQNLNHIASEGFLAFVRLCVKAASLWLKVSTTCAGRIAAAWSFMSYCIVGTS